MKTKTTTKKGKPVFVSDTKAHRRAGRRITEAEVADAVVEVLQEMPGERATIAELHHEIPLRIALSMADLVQSPTRPNEAIWMQQVRNIVSHRNSPGNAIYENRLVSFTGGLALIGAIRKKPPAKSVKHRRRA